MKLSRFNDLDYVPAGHEDPNDPGVWKKVLLKRGDLATGQPQMVNWAKLPPGRTFAAHYHEDMEEFFIMIKGVVRMEVAGEKIVLGPGDTIVIEPREMHQMWNDSGEDAEYLGIGIATGTDGQTVLGDESK